MTPREMRLRQRIDQLLDERERLTIFLRIAEAEQERLVDEGAKLRRQVRELKRSRELWRGRYERDVDALLGCRATERKRRKAA